MSDQHWLNFDELEQLAQKKLPKMVWGYYSSGAETESTLRDNRAAFERLRIMPRIMVDVRRIDTSCTLLGEKLSMPLLIAPMAYQRMAHPEGEKATARAAAQCSIPMVQSTMGTVKLAEVAKAAAGAPLLMFQLYVIKDRDFCRKLILDAERAGYKALAITVDAPHLGNRWADERNEFHLPEPLTPVNLEGLKPPAAESQRQGKEIKSAIAAVFAKQIDPGLTWDFVPWVRSFCKLPILVKGVLSPHDALRALDAGVDGLMVSNHGGRQLDFAPASLDCLTGIKRVIGNRLPILVDGGIRRGSDILKALALGADAVCVGRPVLHGLALDGEQGVKDVIDLLRNDLELAMRLSGCPDLKSITRDMVLTPAEYQSRL